AGARRLFSFVQAEDGIRAFHVAGVQTCALPILAVERALVDPTEESLLALNSLEWRVLGEQLIDPDIPWALPLNYEMVGELEEGSRAWTLRNLPEGMQRRLISSTEVARRSQKRGDPPILDSVKEWSP